MRQGVCRHAVRVAICAAMALAAVPASAGADTRTYAGPSSQALVLPSDNPAYLVTIRALGAQGGAASDSGCHPGLGGLVQATFGLTPGQLTIIVGGAGGTTTDATGGAGGFGGGGAGGTTTQYGGGGGGGQSRVSFLAGPLVVAAGGGGCGAFHNPPTAGDGGDDGSPGHSGDNSGGPAATGGGAGTLGAGGAGGVSATPSDPGGGNGGSGTGGTGASDLVNLNGGGGGGGGGYFGGGGGGGVELGEGTAGGGGGGSDFIAGSATGVITRHGMGAGNGGVKIDFVPACLVPKLKGKSLKRAKRRLRRNDCRIGKVKGDRSGKVKKQKPKPGKVLAAGSRVKVKLG